MAASGAASTGPVPGSRIATLCHADLARAQALVVEAGWNQVRADWELFQALGHVFKVDEPDAGVVATAATLPYAGGFGWISMVLVSQAARRRGIATRLLARSIEQLRGARLASVLDATPAGREVYARLGFVDGWAITRWRRSQGSCADQPAITAKVRPLVDADWPAVLALDASGFGCARPQVLARLRRRSAGFACVLDSAAGLHGFLLGRDGRLATQIGPVVALEEASALAMLGHALSRLEGAVLVDVLDCHAGVAAFLEQRGFAVERRYTRMTLGRAAPSGDTARTFAIGGPEIG